MDLTKATTKELLLELMKRSKVEVKYLKPLEGYVISPNNELIVLSIPRDAYEMEERSR